MSGIGSSRPDGSDGNELNDLSSYRRPDLEAQIGEHSELGIEASVHLQNDSDEDNLQDEFSREERIRLWAELEAERGYSEYIEYLKAYEERYTYLSSLRFALDYIFPRVLIHTLYYKCAIYDINRTNYGSPVISLRAGSSSATKILSTIRQPLSAGIVRIALWEASGAGLKDAAILDAFGLGLGIQPSFFQALLARSTSEDITQTFMDRPLVSQLFVMDQYVVTIARNYLPVNPNAPPVILIARLGPEELAFDQDFDDILPFQRLETDELPTPASRLPAWMLQYIRLLESHLKNEKGSTETVRDILLKTLTPLLHFNMIRIHDEKDRTQREYLQTIRLHDENEERILDHEERLGKLFRMRSSLRRLLEDSEDKAERLKRFVRSQMTNEVRKSTSFTTIEDDLRQTHLNARRCETEILDYLQLQTGELARQESKKSIDLSNFQIEEAKRG